MLLERRGDLMSADEEAIFFLVSICSFLLAVAIFMRSLCLAAVR